MSCRHARKEVVAQGLEELDEVIWFASSRPEKEPGRRSDVLWLFDSVEFRIDSNGEK